MTVLLFGSGRGAGLTSLLALGIAPLAACSGLTYLWRGRFRTRVTAEGIEIRGYFNHFVPWEEVRGIEVRGYGSSMRLDDSFYSSYLRRAYGNRAPSIAAVAMARRPAGRHAWPRCEWSVPTEAGGCFERRWLPNGRPIRISTTRPGSCRDYASITAEAALL